MTERVVMRASCDLPNYGDGYEWQLVTDTLELDMICRDLRVCDFADDITGALVRIGDGDYRDVYLTEDSKPWSVYARWCDVEYYADDIADELWLED